MLVWYLSTHGWTPETWEYEALALSLLDKQEFSYPHLGVDYRSYVGPVYPFLGYLLHLIGGKSLILYVIFHLSLGLAVIWLTYRLATRWLGEQTGVIAGLLVALEPGLLVYNSYKVDVLTLSMCLLLAGLDLFDRVTSTGRYRWSALLGGLAGISAMTRMDLIALLTPYVLWLLLEGTSRRRMLMHGLLAAAVSALVISPWLVRNYSVHGRVLLTTTSGEQLWIGNHAGSTGIPHPEGSAYYLRTAPASIREAVSHGTELSQYDAFRTEAIHTIQGDPAGFLRRALRKFGYFWWFTPAYGEYYSSIPAGLREAYKGLYATLLALAMIGGAAAWRQICEERVRLLLSTVVVVMLVIALIHAVYFVEGRHRVLVMPLLLIFSAAGVRSLFGRDLVYRIGAGVTRLAGRDWGAATASVQRLYLTAHRIGKQLLDAKGLNALTALVRPGMVVCDVGANVGVTTAIFARGVGATGRVLAFEPDPFNAAVLHGHIARRGLSNVLLFEIGLGDSPGRRYLRVNRNNRADSRILPAGGVPTSEIAISCDSLDAVLARQGSPRVDLVKIDVQGFEPFVLRGMGTTLAANPGIQVVLEFFPEGLTEQRQDPQAFLVTLLDTFPVVERWTGDRWAPLSRSEAPAWLAAFGAGAYADLWCHS